MASELTPGSRYGIVEAFRQALEAAVRWGAHEQEPREARRREPAAEARRNPPVHAGGDRPVAVRTWDEVRASSRCSRRRRGCGPSEWRAVEWRDVDQAAVVVLVERTFAFGKAKAYGKTARSRRRVPLSPRALEALDEIPRRLDTRLDSSQSPRGAAHRPAPTKAPSATGSPALEAAGLPGNDASTTCATAFATWALDAGLSIFEFFPLPRLRASR